MSVASNKHKVYVNSIDGLRAICCLGVLFYHMGFRWAQGGLMGVTSFFIISGYLITSGMLKEYSRSHTIDVKNFYIRRVRRLMPAVLAMIAGTAALCVLFDHVLLTKMRGDILPSIFMYINWSKIAAQESYFQAAGLPSPLTCYWSLAIEWQFYLLWPPILLLLMRTARRSAIKRGLLAATAVSALLMAVLYVPGQDPTRVYYGTDTRLMSILLGCWLAFVWPFKRMGSTPAERTVQGRTFCEAVGFAGVAALVAIMVLVDGFSPFSYYGGILLVSVLSTAAVAAIIPQGTLIARALSAKPLVWLGQRSYSLYLWHYPIIELLTDSNSTTGTPWYMQALMFGLSLLAADLSFRYVEEPIRHGGWFGKLKNTMTARQAVGAPEGKRVPSPKRETLPFGQQVVAGAFAACLAVGAIGIALVPPVDAMGGVAGEARITAAALKQPLAQGAYDIVIIGDSVVLGEKDRLTEAFPHGLIDGRVGRQAKEALDVYESYAERGIVGDTVVFMVGTNGDLTEDELESIVEAVGPDKRLWFVSNRMPDEFRDANNQLIRACVDRHGNVGLIDWFGLSAEQNDWFWDDGTHIRQGSDGEAAFVDLIKETIGYKPLTEADLSYSILFLGDDIPLAASDQLATAFPAGCIDCAEGRTPDRIAEAYRSYLDKGVVGSVVALSAGTNAPLDRGEIDSIADAVGPDKELYLVNVRSANRWSDQNNQVIADAAATADNVHLIDWHAASEGHDEYFAGDGEHLSDAGKQAYADLVYAETHEAVERGAAELGAHDAASADALAIDAGDEGDEG